MSTRIDGLASELDALRTEITELDALETPTEEQAARYAECISEWDSKKAAHDDEIARAAKWKRSTLHLCRSSVKLVSLPLT